MSVHNIVSEAAAAATRGEIFDFKDVGIKADVIAESTSGSGVTIDGLAIADGGIAAGGAITLSANSGFTSGSSGNFTAGAGGDFVEGVGSDYYPDNGSATCTSNAATLAKNAGKITTEALSTAGLASQTITVTDTRVAAADIIVCSLELSSGTGGTPILGVVTPGAGSWTAVIHNVHATEAFSSRVFILNFRIYKA